MQNLQDNLADAPLIIQWCQTSSAAQLIRTAKWIYPSIEIVHLAGLILVFGSMLVLNLRIFGRVLRSTPVEEVARGLAPITIVGLLLQLLSGPLLFVTSAVRFYQSVPFLIKIVLLIAALTYHFSVHRPLAFRSTNVTGQLRRSATVSMLSWTGVVLAGLAIELLA